MNDIDEFWNELFGMSATPTEAALMQAVLKKVDSSDSILVQCAVMMRLIYFILVQDKSSPLRMLHKIRGAMDDLTERIRRNTIREKDNHDELHRLFWNVDVTITELREARDYVAEHKSFLSKKQLTKAASLFAIAGFCGTLAALFTFEMIS